MVGGQPFDGGDPVNVGAGQGHLLAVAQVQQSLEFVAVALVIDLDDRAVIHQPGHCHERRSAG